MWRHTVCLSSSALLIIVAVLFLEPKTSKRERRPFGYWQSGFDGEGEHNARAFLDSLARKKGLDPRTPETWYSISAKEIEEEVYLLFFSLGRLRILAGSYRPLLHPSHCFKGGKTLIARFHSVVRLVTEIYPNLEFNPTKFRGMFPLPSSLFASFHPLSLSDAPQSTP